jgi:uncharacterized protein YcgI (DUF1989 family)
MKVLVDQAMPYNTGASFEVRKGRTIRIEGRTTADTVAFNLHNLRERFDQARTKVAQAKIFLRQGDRLLSKFNTTMLTITADTWAGGTHDLQKGMCSASTYQLFAGDLFERYRLRETFGIERKNLPDHGCWENLIDGLKGYDIAPEDIPSPFNVFQDMKIDGVSGQMDMTNRQPVNPEYVDLRAEMDCLVGISACPWFGKGEPLHIVVYE